MIKYRVTIVGFDRSLVFLSKNDILAKAYARREVASIVPSAHIKLQKEANRDWRDLAYRIPRARAWFDYPRPGEGLHYGAATVAEYITLNTRSPRTRVQKALVNVKPLVSQQDEYELRREQLRSIDREFRALERAQAARGVHERPGRKSAKPKGPLTVEDIVAEMTRKRVEREARQAKKLALAAKEKERNRAHQAAQTARAAKKRAETARRKAERIANRNRKD